MNPGLEHVARLINTFAMSGVPTGNLRVAVVIHGPATDIALESRTLSGAASRRQSEPAPDRGVEAAQAWNVIVCGQALAHAGFEADAVDAQVTLALAALDRAADLSEQRLRVDTRMSVPHNARYARC